MTERNKTTTICPDCEMRHDVETCRGTASECDCCRAIFADDLP